MTKADPDDGASEFRGHFMFWRAAAILSALFLCLCFSDRSAAEKYVVLVGAQNYTAALGELRTPLADLDEVANALEATGFKVIAKVSDPKRATLVRAARQLNDKLLQVKDSIGMFYFAGHGGMADGHHVVFGIDTTALTGDAAASHGVKVTDLIEELKDATVIAKLVYVVIDACRDTGGSENGSRGAGSDASRGAISYAEFKGFARPGVFVAFSASAGHKAYDVADSGLNSPHAEAMSSSLREAEIEDVLFFEKVKKRVFDSTRNRAPPQQPTFHNEKPDYPRPKLGMPHNPGQSLAPGQP